MANSPIGNRWRRRASAFIKFFVVMPLAAFAGCSVLALGGDALLWWNDSVLRDWRDFGEEQRLENAVNQALHDGRRPLGQAVLLSELIARPMNLACVEGRGAPSHLWRDGPTRKLMKQSYRPLRRPPFDDYQDTILAVEFADGRVLGLLVPLDRHRVDFGTPDRHACASGGRLSFTRVTSSSFSIRGD